MEGEGEDGRIEMEGVRQGRGVGGLWGRLRAGLVLRYFITAGACPARSFRGSGGREAAASAPATAY